MAGPSEGSFQMQMQTWPKEEAQMDFLSMLQIFVPGWGVPSHALFRPSTEAAQSQSSDAKPID